MKTAKIVGHSFRLTLALNAVATVWLSLASAQTQKTATWVRTGNLRTPRSAHSATLLPDGKVLVAGGWGRQGSREVALNSAELYDPANGTWVDKGSLNVARFMHTATLLPDGKVLVAGGVAGFPQPSWNVINTAELYDPDTGQWSLVGSLNKGTFRHTATLLRNGKVLVAGGWKENGHSVSGTEIYEPETEEWRVTARLRTPRGLHTATLLRNGKVLVTGGGDINVVGLYSTEIFDPIAEKWSPTGNLQAFRVQHAATLLLNGKVLITGGSYRDRGITSSELYDPVTESWSHSRSFGLECSPEAVLTTTLLPNGKVLLAGCFNYDRGYLSQTELYDPLTGTWRLGGDLNTGRSGHTATALLDGKVLVAGGSNYEFPLRSAELYLPAPGPSTLFLPMVLSSPGAYGSFYTSELTLTNRSSQDVTVEFTYTAAFGGGSGQATSTLEAGQQRVAPDTISFLRQLGIPVPASGSGGTLQVRFSGGSSLDDTTAMVRTATSVPNGRAGLAYPGIASRSLLDGVAYLGGLRQNASDRSNVALQNAGEAQQGDITLRLTVYSGNPAAPASKVLPDIAISPGGFRQIDSILTSYGLSLTNGYVRIERVSGTAPYYAYAVINDNSNSDGSFVPPVMESVLAGRTKLTLPVAVDVNGFATELVATNWSTAKKILRCSYVADAIGTADSTANFAIELNPQEQLILPDFVHYLRSLATPGVGPKGPPFAGAIFAQVTAGDLDGIFLAARTSNVSSRGRYGLFYSATPNGMASTTVAWIYGLQQSAETRSNLAIVNTGEKDDSVDVFRIELFDGETGRIASTFETMVNARAWKQIGMVLAQYAPGVTQAYARVTRIAGNNPFVTYAVINDGGQPGERTGDGAFVASTP